MSVHSIAEAKEERAKLRLVDDGGIEARLLVARQAFLCASQISEIAHWLVTHGDLPAAANMQACADGVIGSAETIRRAAKRDQWLAQNRPGSTAS